jgi:uncharacterized protein YjbJ (UPF0337 family)
MDRDRVALSANKIKEAIKKGVERLTGDRKAEAEGRVDKAKGDVQESQGEVKDSLRGKP